MILHVDMDAFYASVEERENPDLKGKPVVVGGAVASRGVVAAANYEARKYGVFSAMPMATAVRKCPNILIVKANGKLYSEISAQIRGIFERYTPVIEPLSLDEAFLDPSGSEKLHGSAEHIGKKIKQDIRAELRLVASVGVAPNKFLAKLASDHNKPDGFTVIKPTDVQTFLDPMPVGRIWGVGKVSNRKFQNLGIYTVADLRQESKESLYDLMGKHGEQLWRLARGIDNREVTPDSDTKSISQETTFENDIGDPSILESIASSLTEAVGFRLRNAGLKGKTVNLKLRFSDFQTITRSRTLNSRTDQTIELSQIARLLLHEACGVRQAPVRLIGIGVSNFLEEHFQTDIFDAENRFYSQKDNHLPGRGRQIDELSDHIKKRFGKNLIQRGKSIDRKIKG